MIRLCEACTCVYTEEGRGARFGSHVAVYVLCVKAVRGEYHGEVPGRHLHDA
jgi:hypothetical protein